MGHKLGIDVGGTFTDFLLVTESGEMTVAKTPSTPARPAEAVIKGLEKLAGSMKSREFVSQIDLIVHGTTITTNAVLTRRFARTGYVTTKGFRDLLNSRRGIKRTAFTAKEAPPEPIVPRSLIQCVEERVDSGGRVLVPLDEADVHAAAEFFRREGVEAVAVNLIFSFLNPSHERRVREILERELPGVYVSIASEVLPQPRVYERGSTTAFNACLGPVLRRYIADLTAQLREHGFRGQLLLMQSNGGVATPERAMDFAAHTLLSGPAGGPVAGIYVAAHHDLKNLITMDMGGTSFDSCLILNQEPEVTAANEVAEYCLALPSLAIHTIGAGGGSIARIDSRGILEVGPASAGADPGPACYGLGGEEPTTTDANVVLGYLNPDYFLGGERRLYPERAEEAIEGRIAKPLGLGVREAAFGVYQVVNANMANGVRTASISRGADPRACVLVVAGGAGPLHACAIALDLQMTLILVPKNSSVFCASGMLISDLRHDFVRFAYMRMTKTTIDLDTLNARCREMRAQGEALLGAERIPPERRTYSFSLDLRYEGQFNEIETPYPGLTDWPFGIDDLALLQAAFDRRHDSLYGYSLAGSPMELLSVRMRAVGLTDKLKFKEMPRGGEDAGGALKGRRPAFVEREPREVPVYDGMRLRHGNRLVGPAIVEEPTTTILVLPGWQFTLDRYGNYLLFLEGESLEACLSRLRAG
jgi:N-methylhydantoinase A